MTTKMMNKWDQIKALLPDTLEAHLLIKTIENQVHCVANNVAEIQADSDTNSYLTTPTLIRIKDIFGIIGKAEENDVT